jgi:hypothetical protein
MARQHSNRTGVRSFGLLSVFALALGALAAWTALPGTDEVQHGEGEEPIQVLVVQGYVKQIDEENLVLTAPGAPHDLPLLLHPQTRYVNGEEDVKREDVQEGQFVRAALIPAENGEDLLAIVVEIVPEGKPEPPPSEPPGDPGTLGEPDPMPRFDDKDDTTDL